MEIEQQYAVECRRVDGGTTTLYVRAKSPKEARDLASQDQEVERAIRARLVT